MAVMSGFSLLVLLTVLLPTEFRSPYNNYAFLRLITFHLYTPLKFAALSALLVALGIDVDGGAIRINHYILSFRYKTLKVFLRGSLLAGSLLLTRILISNYLCSRLHLSFDYLLTFCIPGFRNDWLLLLAQGHYTFLIL